MKKRTPQSTVQLSRHRWLPCTAALVGLAFGGFDVSAQPVYGLPLLAPDRFADFPAFHRLPVLPIAGPLAVQGRPLRMGVLETAASPASVARHYRDAWLKAGRAPVAFSSGAVAHVAIFEGTTQRSITALRAGPRETLVLLSEADTTLLPSATPPPIPVPPDATGLLALRVEGEVSGWTAHFTTTLAPHAVRAFYTHTLREQGFASTDDIRFVRPGEETEIRSAPLDRGSAVFVTQRSVATSQGRRHAQRPKRRPRTRAGVSRSSRARRGMSRSRSPSAMHRSSAGTAPHGSGSRCDAVAPLLDATGTASIETAIAAAVALGAGLVALKSGAIASFGIYFAGFDFAWSLPVP